MTEPYVIKKYANRRLYDTVASRHVTLDGIRDLIVNGHDIKIIDDTSGDDITRMLLLQIIAEQEQNGRPILNEQFLVRMIRLYGSPIQEMMGEYLSRSFDAFSDQQALFQKQMRAAMAETPLATLQDMAKGNMKLWQSMQDAMTGKKRDDHDD